jgi:hypothetical protein
MSKPFTFVRHSPSSLNLFSGCLSMFVMEKILGKRQPVGPAAHRGNAVEDGVAHGLDNPDATLAECVEIAERKFRELSALSGDPRKEKIEAGIAPMVERALAELRPYGKPSSKQGFIEWKPEGLKHAIVGYYDFMFDQHGIVFDLKTTQTLPSQIKPAHARQVALYTGGNLEGRLGYFTPAKSAVYRLENVKEHRDALHKMALACERFLSLSDDPAFFVSITSPDLDSFYFGTPQARQMAYETWGV